MNSIRLPPAIVIFRFLFGALAAAECVIYLIRGFVDAEYPEHGFRFPYAGLDWLPQLSLNTMHVIFWALVFLGLCIALGLFYRLATVLFFALFSYVFFLDQANYLNQLYLIWCFALLFAVTPAHKSWSLDATLTPGFKARPIDPLYTWAFRFQVGLVYTFAAFAKMSPDWLHGRPMNLWLAEKAPSLVPLAAPMSWCGMLFDLLIFPALLWKRTRWAATFVCLSFHLTNAFLFDIGIFPFLMLATIVLFIQDLPPFRFRELTEKLPRPIAALLVVFIAVQTGVAMRCWFYPGNSAWTDEGTTFSWRMKLTDKKGEAKFFLTDRQAQAESPIDLTQFLSPHQLRVMPKYPEMLHAFARHLRRVLIMEGDDKGIRCESYVSLNGRPKSLIVDPTKDISLETLPIFGGATWILPLPGEVMPGNESP